MATFRVTHALFQPTASTTQTLPEPAAVVLAVQELSGRGGTAVVREDFQVVTTPPASGQVQFTGSPSAPSDQLVFASARTTDGWIWVRYVRPGDIP